MIKGDHLVSSRLGYSHHGLYIGNGEVIHYSGFSELFDKGSIEVTTLEDFEQGRGSFVENHFVSVYDADERVERACSKLGEDSYNLLFNNCEHFVNWCFNGFKTSSQVNNAVVGLAKVVANEYATKKATEAAAFSIITQQVTSTASTVTGVTAASALTGTTAAGVASAFSAGSVASIAAPVAIAVGVGYGVKKVIDWFWD